jgi:hypothetical protein
MKAKQVSLRSRRDFWVIAVIVLLAIGFVSCGKAPEPTPTPVPPTDTPVPPTDTPEPTATRTERPTWTPPPTATEILATSTPDWRYECIPLEMVGDEHVGEEVCVYGEFVKWQSGQGYAGIYRFTEENDHFLIKSTYYYYTIFEEGDCIWVAGEIKYNGQYYYIEWGKELEDVVIGWYDSCQ